MIYPTPSKEFDGVTVGLKLLEKAVEMIDLAQDARGEPWDTSEYLGEAANLVHDAWLAIQTAYGRALSEEAERKERHGMRQCVLCQQWRPINQMVRETAGYGSEKKGKVNHWWRCRGSQDAPQTAYDDQDDPFLSEEGL